MEKTERVEPLSGGEQGAAAGRNLRKFMLSVTESVADSCGIPRSILKMSFLTGYPYNTKKWHRLQYHFNRLYKDFPKNSRKIKKYIRLINKMDRSLSGRVMRIDWYNIRIRQEQFKPVHESIFNSWLNEEIEAGRIHVNIESMSSAEWTKNNCELPNVIKVNDDSWDIVTP